MDNKTDFLLKLSDYFVAVLIGSLSAIAIHFAVSPSWGMLMAMLAGMAISMVVMTIIILPFALVGGIFEILMPGMFIANFAGMASGMWVVTHSPSLNTLLAFGFLTGLLINSIFNLYDGSLHGEIAKVGNDSLK